ncbi:PREDICTED: zinc finger protein 777-like [Nipponia nippon]|uniref:zinc finger protein 777-like n=1 Tax=Nipponia nippon TaxID=128390 RepID=UPI0005112BC5|nr:PREDICTED: zinc finger protein 777-like [Nipponia nippon]
MGRGAGVGGRARPEQLQELWSRTERAEQRLLACENLVGELGSNLAALGSLLQDYGHLQQRLDNVENLLKNRNFWILRLPPGSRGEVPKVPVTFDDISVYFNEQEWERLDRWQKDLYRAVMRGNYEMLISLDYAVSKPDVLSWIERDEELCAKDGREPPRAGAGAGEEPPPPAEELDQREEALGEDEVPMEADTDYAISKPDVLSRIEKDEELCAKDGQEPPQAAARAGEEPPQTGVRGGPESPQTQSGDGPESLQTGVPDSPESLQIPEEMDQKEEALGEDKVPVEADTELPILVMNVTSLSARKEALRRKDQPETEMGEERAESSTEEGVLLGNETACEGAPPPDKVKVKEEEPEAPQEVSAPSPGSEIQKCPKSEQAKAKSKKKPSRCTNSRLLMGNCRRGYVREWSHPCTECGKRFRLKINLIIHQRSHAKEGPYECTMCEISFTDKSRLDLHQSIHIKDRAFGAKVWGNVHPELRIRPRRKFCEVFCEGAHSLGSRTYAGGPWLGQAKEEAERARLSSACFSRQQDPKARRKPVPQCNLCKKIFSCSSSLQRHLRTHSGDRPYCCTACQKCFTRKTHLLRHEKIHARQKRLAALRQPAEFLAHQPRHAGQTLATRPPQPKRFQRTSSRSLLRNSDRQTRTATSTAGAAEPSSLWSGWETGQWFRG